MKVLHLIKTSDGADWAFKQVAELIQNRVEVHVILPSEEGRFVDNWKATGAQIHFLDLNLSVFNPFSNISRGFKLRSLVKEIKPDLVHSHFFITTLFARWFLRGVKIPRIFQVPGPLHLEHFFFKYWEILSSTKRDFWIASSKFIKNKYEKASFVKNEKVFLSYYGSDPGSFTDSGEGILHKELKLEDDKFIVGNINHMYPPKTYLGQRIGLKCHEDILEALSKERVKLKKIVGVFIGGQWGTKKDYEEKLKKLQDEKCKFNAIMYGHMDSQKVKKVWADFDLAIHVPSSENCGGVIEPLMAGVPVIASKIGGLPEVIIPGKTGELVDVHSPDQIADKVIEVFENQDRYKKMALNGQKLVKTMFDVKRTAGEVYNIYLVVLGKGKGFEEFNSEDFLS